MINTQQRLQWANFCLHLDLGGSNRLSMLLKIHGNCPAELTSVILQLEESTGSIAVDQIGRSIILYRPSTSKMKKRQEVAENARRFARAKEEMLGDL
ncbi:hypothetical protein PVAP13_9NG298046 [Panicum virgatum]|uniref:CRM domain-containing protein n=1 Tax=Panicum virgatum TaxID=38727 RepID=A0A8T0MJ97_PANVG|nr:hypothetical protein PVAP13_9NG298046 [Panicum virgatum]